MTSRLTIPARRARRAHGCGRAALNASPSLVNANRAASALGRPAAAAAHGDRRGNREVFDLLLAAGADINGNNQLYESGRP